MSRSTTRDMTMAWRASTRRSSTSDRRSSTSPRKRATSSLMGPSVPDGAGRYQKFSTACGYLRPRLRVRSRRSDGRHSGEIVEPSPRVEAPRVAPVGREQGDGGRDVVREPVVRSGYAVEGDAKVPSGAATCRPDLGYWAASPCGRHHLTMSPRSTASSRSEKRRTASVTAIVAPARYDPRGPRSGLPILICTCPEGWQVHLQVRLAYLDVGEVHFEGGREP